MGPTQVRTTALKKRVRKRRRRVLTASSSSSSSSSSSDSSSLSEPDVQKTGAEQKTRDLSALSSPSSSASSSSSGSGSDSDTPAVVPPLREQVTQDTKEIYQQRQPSSSPPASPLPSFLPRTENSKDATNEEQMLRERFRKFWMASMADGFKEDLEEIRKEQNLGQSRLALLIDSLASGANVFSSSKDGQVNEMEAAIGPNA